MTRVSLVEGLRRTQTDDALPFIDLTPAAGYALVTEVARRPEALVLVLHGVLDDESVRELRSAFDAAFSEPAATFALDMTAVTFVDSDGFGAMIHMQKRLTETGRQLVLVNCQEAVRLALALTRLEVLFPMFARVADIATPRP